MTFRTSTLWIALAFFGCTHFDGPSDIGVGNLNNTDSPPPQPPSTEPIEPPVVGVDPPQPLISRGLMARYMINEDTSGTDTTIVRDFGNSPVDMDVVYDNGGDQFVEINGHRGVQFRGLSDSHGLFCPGDENKFERQIQNETQFTFETVIDIQDIQRGSRIMYLGQKDESGLIQISIPPDENRISMGWRRVQRVVEWPLDYKSFGRMTLTFVIDFSHPDVEQRVRFYLNGGRINPINSPNIPENQVLDYFDANETLMVLANSATQDDAIEGIYYYAGFYNTALTDNEILSNANRLLLDDDTP